ncbi:hypothetical protein FRB97_003185 [Tulasnella sp. 331]|nr:hypothetical protein FRB97_003185 [Tulasnella sp. 331]
MQPDNSPLQIEAVVCTEILLRLSDRKAQAGKTTVVRAIQRALSSPEHGLSVCVLSLDDLYLSHTGLVHVADTHAMNTLLRGRGQPGTHDVDLGHAVLQGLLEINHTTKSVDLPSFDKSLFNGEGDRAPMDPGRTIESPIDVVIVEGWCMGFYPLGDSELERRYYEVKVGSKESGGLPNIPSIMEAVSLEDMKTINGYLKEYPLKLYTFFGMLVQITAGSETPYAPIYKWRLQQEHHMKSLNGGRGMTDDQVKL